MLSAGSLKADHPDTTAGNRNPLVPGYFADPSIKKFGDTYYLYTTTDGVKLASGEPQVWMSKDFVSWYNMEMDVQLPEGLTNCWAPDVVKGRNGKYYYFMGNCERGCNIYGYVSETPVGPWKSLKEGNPIIAAGTGIKDLPALDAQFFWDDDSTLYSYFGTWCTSFKGMGWVVIDTADMTTIRNEGYIPIQQIPHAFEGAFALKRNGMYILMYSSGDCRLNTYAVRYAFSRNPEGPFIEGANNPLMASSSDGSIDSPGHHSVLTENNTSYIVYHRHNNPHSTGGEFRQICADTMIFENDSIIKPIHTTHNGIGIPATTTPPNIAYKAAAFASSFYHLISEPTRFAKATNYNYSPAYATDDNNGTLWKAADGMLPQSITIDLGSARIVKRVMTQFEYATYYYQYRLDYSIDGKTWKVYADKSNNRRSGSPMIDDFSAGTRYLRLTITGTEMAGMYAAVWNIKVFDQLFEVPEILNPGSMEGPGVISSNSLLVDLNIENTTQGVLKDKLSNRGTLGGVFLTEGTPQVTCKEGVKCIYFDGSSYLRLSKNAPPCLGWNSAYTAAAWVYNPEAGNGECLVVWNSRDNMLQSSYAALMYGTGPFGAVAHGDGYVDLPYKGVPEGNQWHHIAVTFDGMIENVYVDGKLNTQLPISLFTQESSILIGASGEESENYSGFVAGLQLFDKALSHQEMEDLMNSTRPKALTQK
jgi:hypothetical protein